MNTYFQNQKHVWSVPTNDFIIDNHDNHNFERFITGVVLTMLSITANNYGTTNTSTTQS